MNFMIEQIMGNRYKEDKCRSTGSYSPFAFVDTIPSGGNAALFRGWFIE